MDSIAKTLTLIAVLVSGNINQAIRILVVSPVPSGSHAILGEACVKILLEAGYEVVYVTALPNRLQARPELVEVDVSSNAKYFLPNELNLSIILENTSKPLSILNMLDNLTTFAVKTVKHEAVQTLLNDGKKIDLVIAEWMFTEIYAGLPAFLDCPLIWFSSMEPHSMILSLVDEELNPAYNADLSITHVVPSTFFQRVEQLGMRLFLMITRMYYIYFKETQYFNDLYAPMMKKLEKKLPTYDELRYNASLVLSNSHRSIGQVIRLPPNFISIGGYHIDPHTKPLSEDLKKIMDNATHGVIYFSMGSILKSKDFPQKLKIELLNMFKNLKQEVIWKFEEVLPNLPSNVHVLKWASQQSILSHYNCVLFITHGGLLSLTESIHYGVPVIGIPGFADQFVNVMRAQQKGFAKKVDLSYDMAKNLNEAIEEVIYNPEYKEKVKALSFEYHHRPVNPRKELVHWVEHVIKTKGAPFLRSPALNVAFYQKLYLDLAVLILVLFFVLRFIAKRFISRFLKKTLHKDNVSQTKKVN